MSPRISIIQSVLDTPDFLVFFVSLYTQHKYSTSNFPSNEKINHLDKGNLFSEIVKEVEGTTDASAVVASDRSTEDLEKRNDFSSPTFDNDDNRTTT